METHLQGTFLPRSLAVTFQHLPVDPQPEDLSCDFIVIRHSVPPELQFGVRRWLEAGAVRAVGVRPELRTNYRLLLLSALHVYCLE